MQSFLQLVAHDLYTKIGNDLSRTVLVFPNKRANLFFNEYLAGESDKPIWSPAAMSISDLFQKLSVQKSGDPIRLVCELYKVFKEETRSQETLDDFYFWGELLISDFDDVDKNMVDADKLFSNLQDLKNLMDDYEFLDKEQEEAIQQFFQNFSIEKRTELKEKFISLWDKLGTIYHRYRANLTELGIAYEGMLYRNVIEQLDTDQLKYDKYIFVGFNVLNKVESDFFRKLKDAGKALFYWDYDIFYTQQIKKHEAGEFLKRNLEEFPNELPESFFNTFKEPKKIRYIMVLHDEIEILEGGSLDYPITVKGKDELSELAEGLDCMRVSFQGMIEREANIVQENQKMITEMSHDIRTPVTSIMLYTEILKNGKYKDEEQLNEYIERIDRKAHRMKQLTDNFFEYMLVTGDDEIELEEPEFCEALFYDLFSETISYLEQRGFDIDFRVEWSDKKLRICSDYIIRIMDNIASNIIKYADPKKPVIISSVYVGGMVGFAFENSNKPNDEKVDSTCVGIQSIKSMMLKMGGICKVTDNGGSFCIVIAFKGYKY